MCVCVFRTVQSQNRKKKQTNKISKVEQTALAKFLKLYVSVSITAVSWSTMCAWCGRASACPATHPSCNLTDHEVIEVNPDMTFDPLTQHPGFWPSEPKCLGFTVWGGRNVMEARPWKSPGGGTVVHNDSAFDASVVPDLCLSSVSSVNATLMETVFVFCFFLGYKIFGEEQLELKCVG